MIRRPPSALAHSLKIFTPFANSVGWMHGIRKAKGVPNGFSVIGTKLTRSVVVSFDSGIFVLKCILASCSAQPESRASEYFENFYQSHASLLNKGNHSREDSFNI